MDYTVAIFDLDNCLMDARAVGPLFEPAFEAVRQANQGALSPEALEQALQACWFTAFDLVAQRHHFTPAMRAAGWQQFSQMEAKAPLRGYADIELLPRIPLRRYLVTSGFRRLQDSKIDALRIRPWFEQVLIDAIDAPPTGAAHGKQAIFEQILAREGCAPRQMLVVGDNPLSELSAGRALGATTVQTVRPGVEPWPLADHRVEGLQGLLALLSPDAPRAARRAPQRIRPQRAQTRGFERNRRQALVEHALVAIKNIVCYRCAPDTPRRVGWDHGRQSAPTFADLARFSP